MILEHCEIDVMCISVAWMPAENEVDQSKHQVYGL